MPRLEGEELEDTVVVQCETVDGASFRGETDDGARHGGVCKRGAVPDEVAIVVEVAAQVRN